MKKPKLLILLSFVFLAFTLGDSKGKYHIPAAGVSINSCDIDLDGDTDIVIGHNYISQTEWGGFSFLLNDSFGNFSFTDSLYIYASQTNIYSINILGDEIPEIIGRYYDGQQNLAIIEINNWDFNVTYHPMGSSVTHFNYGDISGNSTIDFAFISNNNFLWGIIYNDGTGNFSAPEYFDLDFPPVDINCADLNGDGRSDVVICGSNTDIYFSTETGFEQQILTTTTSHDVLLSDFNNDGDIDIITHRTLIYPTHRVFFFENLGNNQFYEHPYFDFSPFCSYAQIADFDNDSLPDLVFIASDHSGLYIYKNIGNFQLEYQQFILHENMTLQGLFCEDYDNNGFQDIAFTNGFGQIDYYLNILFNDGEGNFQENPITEIKTPNSKLQTVQLKCYPNPFKTETTISFNIKENGKTQLQVFDINGKLIKTIINKELQRGKLKIKWNGTDKNGKGVNVGTYLIRLTQNGQLNKQVKLIKL